MSEIKLTKAQRELFVDLWAAFSDTPGHELDCLVIPSSYPGTKEYVREIRVARGLIAKGLIQSDMHADEYKLTESGLAYCKKHFTTTEQP